MRVKRATLVLLLAALAGIGVYFGISCAASLQSAVTQPHLSAGAERFDFLGYYMIAALNGVLSAAALLAFGLLLAGMSKRRKLRKK